MPLLLLCLVTCCCSAVAYNLSWSMAEALPSLHYPGITAAVAVAALQQAAALLSLLLTMPAIYLQTGSYQWLRSSTAPAAVTRHAKLLLPGAVTSVASCYYCCCSPPAQQHAPNS
jgi:hypothetical protein